VSDEWEAFRNDEGEPIRAEELQRLNLKDMPEDIHISIMDHYFPDTRICSRAVGCDQRPLSCPATIKVLWGTISDRRSSELRCGCKTFLAVGKDVITSKMVGRAGSDRPLLPHSRPSHRWLWTAQSDENPPSFERSSGGPHWPHRSIFEIPKLLRLEHRFTRDYSAFRTASPIARVLTRSQPGSQISPVRNPLFNTFLRAFSIRAACSGRSSE
jgi:hypothetical protein